MKEIIHFSGIFTFQQSYQSDSLTKGKMESKFIFLLSTSSLGKRLKEREKRETRGKRDERGGGGGGGDAAGKYFYYYLSVIPDLEYT